MTAAPRRRVGVITVHGIGRQQPGMTRRRVATSLHRALPTARRFYDPTASAEILATEDTEVFIYEAHWADILSGARIAGSFRFARFGALIWYALLSPKSRLTDRAIAPVALLMMLAVTPLVVILTFCRAYSSRLQTLLDDVPADVVNYCDSASTLSITRPELHSAASEITSRITERIERATKDGCDATYMVAHSLGSVIVVRVLLREKRLTSRISGLVTTGSPLRHLARAYPELLAARRSSLDIEWHNFYDPLDVIARPTPKPLRTSHTHDHRSFGWGGLFSSHFRYERSSQFTRVISEWAWGAPPQRWGWAVTKPLGLAIAAIRDLAFVAVLLLAYSVGAGVCVVVAGITLVSQTPQPDDFLLDLKVVYFPHLIQWTLIFFGVGFVCSATGIVVSTLGAALSGRPTTMPLVGRRAFSALRALRLSDIGKRRAALVGNVCLCVGVAFAVLMWVWGTFFPPFILPTALCNDDTLSWEVPQSRACVSHGGIHWWLVR
jgi:hypothetical protein